MDNYNEIALLVNSKVYYRDVKINEYIKKICTNHDISFINNLNFLCRKNFGDSVQDKLIIESRSFCQRIWDIITEELGINLPQSSLSGLIQVFILNEFIFPIELARAQLEKLSEIVKIKKIHIYGISACEPSSIGAFEIATTKNIPIITHEHIVTSKIIDSIILKLSRDALLNKHVNKEFIKIDSNTSKQILFYAPYKNWLGAIKPIYDYALSQNMAASFIQNSVSNIKMNRNSTWVAESDNILAIISKKMVYRLLINETDYSIQTIQILADYIYKSIINLASACAINSTNFEELCSAIDIESIVVGTGTKSYALGNIAPVINKLGIRSIEVQHGIIDSDGINYFKPLCQNKILVGGSQWRSQYSKTGFNEDRIVVTGWPKLDWVSSFKEKGSDGPLRLLMISQPIYRNTIFNLTQYLSKKEIFNKNFKLYVKPHPADPINYYNKLNNNNIIVYSNTHPITDALINCDAVVIINSTTGWEAIACGKTVIVYDVPNVSNNVTGILMKSKNVVHATSPDNLFSIVNSLSTGFIKNDDSNFLKDNFYLLDGQSSKRALSEIIN